MLVTQETYCCVIFGGIEKAHPDFDAKYGASAVLIYSDKGKYLFKDIPDMDNSKEKSLNMKQLLRVIPVLLRVQMLNVR